MRRVKPPHDFLADEEFDNEMHTITDYFFPSERLNSLMHYDEVLTMLFHEFIDEFKDKFAKDAYVDAIYENFKDLVSNMCVQTQIMVESSSLEQVSKRKKFMEEYAEGQIEKARDEYEGFIADENSGWYREWGNWAFGDAFNDYLCLDKDFIDLKDAWNILHGDLYKIGHDEHLNATKLIEIWRQQQNG